MGHWQGSRSTDLRLPFLFLGYTYRLAGDNIQGRSFVAVSEDNTLLCAVGCERTTARSRTGTRRSFVAVPEGNTLLCTMAQSGRLLAANHGHGGQMTCSVRCAASGQLLAAKHRHGVGVI